MATPRADSYAAASGAAVAGGRAFAANPRAPVLDLIAAAPANSWVKLNTNTFESAWAHPDLRQGYPYSGLATPDSPSRILGKWGSAGWDSNRGRFVIFGGGHANIGLNEVYTWSCESREWGLAFASTAMVQASAYPRYRCEDGSPVSSHTYANNEYLPTIDRFFTGGGAAAGDGGPLRVNSGNTILRDAGGHTLDLTLAGQGYVAGAAGSNIKYGSYAGVDLPGANAWKLRDWGAINGSVLTTGSNGNQLERIESGCVRALEGGKDVLYWVGNNRMWKTTFNDDNPANDTIQQITGYQNARETNGSIAWDPGRQLLLMPNGRAPGSRLFYFVDIKRGVQLDGGFTSVTTATGSDATGFISADGLSTSCGVAFDTTQDAFVLWRKGRQPWLIRPPAGNPTPSAGWVIEQPSMDAGTPAPPTATDPNDSGVIGKMRWAEDLGCVVVIENINEGNVWALKLAGWQDPRN